jgi:hypothetical protein
MPQHDLETCLIEVEQAIEAALGRAVELFARKIFRAKPSSVFPRRHHQLSGL